MLPRASGQHMYISQNVIILVPFRFLRLRICLLFRSTLRPIRQRQRLEPRQAGRTTRDCGIARGGSAARCSDTARSTAVLCISATERCRATESRGALPDESCSGVAHVQLSLPQGIFASVVEYEGRVRILGRGWGSMCEQDRASS